MTDAGWARVLTMLALFCTAIALNAFLLFLIQPMFAKMALPLLGGSPAVWTTCMVFFQAVLLAGYVYSHAAVRLLGVRRQAVLHVLLMALPLLLLPISLAGAGRPPATTAPIGWLLAVLASSVGLPFLMLSTTAPLIQRWFAAAAPSKADPYFLYACSNAGSLAALIAYPTLIEPLLSLRAQRIAWAVGYAVVAALITASALAVLRLPEGVLVSEAREAAPPVPRGRRLRWLALSFVPSGLMLAVTSHVSTDIAAVPMLWVVPLALYLSTFIVAFGTDTAGVLRIAQRLLPLVLLPLVLLMSAELTGELWFVLPLHLGAFWLLAFLCHRELAAIRPPASQLTGFYVWMAAGGVLGGLFNTLVAPNLFVRVAEYPLLIAAGCLVVAAPAELLAMTRSPRVLVRPILAGILAAGILAAASRYGIEPVEIMPLLGVPALLCFSVSRQRAPFAAGIALLLAAGLVSTARGWGEILYAHRTFFGLYRVAATRDDRFVSLFHGTTVHGSERRSASDAPPEPLTYYYRGSPVGDVFAARTPRSVGVIGLGVGSLAAYARPGEHWTFYEIDPEVERIARDDRFFTFLGTCAGECEVVLGDGRLTLDAAPVVHDIIVLDAFSSDAIPVHLLTRDAIEIYLRHLSDAGLLVFHISNRHFDLQPVLGRLAADRGLVAMARHDSVQPNASNYSQSRWLVMGRSRGNALAGIAGRPGWTPVPPDGGRVWTDDFSNVWSVLKWR